MDCDEAVGDSGDCCLVENFAHKSLAILACTGVDENYVVVFEIDGERRCPIA
jgi:hypothetical protein